MEELQKIVEQLRPVLTAELELELQLKATKELKERLLQQLDPYLTTDSYSTEFCTISRRRDYDLEIVDLEEVEGSLLRQDYKLDKDKVIDAFLAIGSVDGISVTPTTKIEVRKKRNGLI